MAFTVTLFNFYKKINSTKRPPDNGDDFECVLKDGTSVYAPVLKLQFAPDVTPANYNYAYIDEFKRYYFVSDWVFNNRLWECNLTTDSLATFKYQIGNSTEYVLRANINYDSFVTDTLYPTRNVYNYVRNNFTSSITFNTEFSEGSYVISVVNKQALNGATSYYILTFNQFKRLVTQLLNPAFLNISDISNDLTKALVDPFQYLISCNWFPLTLTKGPSVNDFDYGWWDFNFSTPIANQLGSATMIVRGSATIPHHMQDSRGSYLNTYPYSKYTLTLQGLGTIDISSTNVGYYDYVEASYLIDKMTGQAILAVTANTVDKSVEIMREAFQMAVPVPLAQIRADFWNIAQSGVEVARTLTGGNVVDALIGNKASAIANIASAGIGLAQSMIPTISTKGSQGSLTSFISPNIITGFFQAVVPNDPDNNGIPVCAPLKLSTYPGYIQCLHGDIQIEGFSQDMENIKNHLESGFFYE